MLIKDTTGKILTDTLGRVMTTKDRWHPLVVSFIKRVREDGGEIITPAIEEMNQMAWEGKFDDALYVYFAGARKAGKTYALIPNDGSGDLEVERDSVAWEWSKYRLLNEIVNDMPEMAFDPEIRQFKGLANRNQITNYLTYSSDFENSDWNLNNSTRGGTITSIIDEKLATEILKNGSSDNERTNQDFVVSASGTYTFFVIVKNKDVTGASTIAIRNQSSAGAPLSRLRIDWNGQEATATATGVWTSNIISFYQRDLKNGFFQIGFSFSISNTSNTYRAEIDIDRINSNETTSIYMAHGQVSQGQDVDVLVITDDSIATRLADNLPPIPVPEGTTEIHTEIDGVQEVQTEDLPENWEFPENSVTKYVIIK